MRKWINIVEGVTDNLLYHGTSIVGLCYIASQNMLGAYGGENQASFTLDPKVAGNFTKSAIDLCKDGQLAHYSDFYNDPNNSGSDGTPYVAYRAEIVAGGKGAVLAFNRSALHRDFAFKSVNFDSEGLERVDFGYSGGEMEECVFENVNNLDRYITNIIIDREGFDRYCLFVREHLKDCPETMQVLAAGETWVNRFS